MKVNILNVEKFVKEIKYFLMPLKEYKKENVLILKKKFVDQDILIFIIKTLLIYNKVELMILVTIVLNMEKF